MRGTDADRRGDPGPREKAGRQEHQQETDKEGGVGDRSNEKERGILPDSGMDQARCTDLAHLADDS